MRFDSAVINNPLLGFETDAPLFILGSVFLLFVQSLSRLILRQSTIIQVPAAAFVRRHRICAADEPNRCGAV